MVAPLFWGLGHVTRCIPIIKALQEHSFNVLLASDGQALMLLQKEFPELPIVELPSYNITYPKIGRFLKWHLLWKLPHFLKTIAAEKRIIQLLVSEGKIDGIISDNRLGVRNEKVPSVLISHQLNVLSGNTSFLSSKIHQEIIKKFTECWVPDIDGYGNLSGKLGHLTNPSFRIKYIGPLSRLKRKELPKKYDILAIISGPEPQRTFFEKKLIDSLRLTSKKVLLVRGVIESEQNSEVIDNIRITNFMETNDLETAISESEIVVARSGYTTIMDLAALNKDAFFIPTPGQYEQLYLAKRLEKLGIVPFCSQENFTLEKLEKNSIYRGLRYIQYPQDFKALFNLFEGK